MVKMILAYFASADSLVNANIEENFCQEIELMEANFCLHYQAMMEVSF